MNDTAAVCIQCLHTDPGVPDVRTLRHWAHHALPPHYRDAELTIRIVGEAEGLRLNQHWRGGQQATNVLSFPTRAPEHTRLKLLGDIVICAPVVAREARAAQLTPAAHWAHMVVHGVLHLLGHDHQRTDEALHMERLEGRILGQLGFDDPYQERG